MYSTHFGSHTSLLQHISVKKLTVCDRGRSLGPGGEVHKTSMSPPQSKFAVIILVCHLMRLNSTCDLVKWGPPMWKFLNIILFSKIAGCLYLHKELILETSY
ncbi:uncharacterized protein LOC114260397 isoform X3 [Camellia sinensis]|uniref:uncharacterized protein LOC114260397 isoform X3 n=1 Tax=Camellia sinensis TaxID=4442 RepID=UPI0010361F52|nr:uncharacterized protein LOC114260397 isoform X3 [Camellia sinensis]XP_028056286.1 uncharacterized protein LOC114260397 isoform X3 [Camellia sinensis]